MDEKPYRFNSAGGDKVWARRGNRAIKCRERRNALLERWTGITASYSQRYGQSASSDRWQPKRAALFKAKTGDRCDVHAPDASVQVLFVERGSVTTLTWLKYLDYILPTVDQGLVLTTSRHEVIAPRLGTDCQSDSLARGRRHSPTGGVRQDTSPCLGTTLQDDRVTGPYECDNV